MAIIGNVERKNWKVKFLNVMIHVILILGAATMVYPLLLMLSGSVKSGVDFKDFSIMPEYLSSSSKGRTLLFRKHLATKYNNSVLHMSQNIKDPTATFDNVMPPDKKENANLAGDYAMFLAECKKTLPHYWFCIGMAVEPGIDAYSVRNYRDFMQNSPNYGSGRKTALAEINERYGTQYAAWDELSLPAEYFFQRRSATDYSSGILASIKDFKYSEYVTPLVEIWPDLEGELIAVLRRDCGRNLRSINSKLGTNYNSWSEISLPARVPADNPAFAAVWTDFVKSEVNLDFISIDPKKANGPWRLYLKGKYGDINTLNRILGTKYLSFEAIEISPIQPRDGVVRTDWQDFVKAESTVPKQWKDFLKKKYNNRITELNKSHLANYRDFNTVDPAYEYPPEKLPEVIRQDLAELKLQVMNNRTKELPSDAITLDTLANRYRIWLKAHFHENLNSLNNAYGFGYNEFDDIELTAEPCGEKNLRQNDVWFEFVKTLPPQDVSLARQATGEYKKYVMELYTKNGVCDFAKLAEDYDITIHDKSENSIPAYLSYPGEIRHATDKAKKDYLNAVTSERFASMRRIEDPKRQKAKWHEFLAKKYKSIEDLNKDWHLIVQKFENISLPTREYEWDQMERNADMLCHEYFKRNYLMVFNTLFTNGDAALNTLIYCFLAVLAALLVNPLCAYGLSRYKPASTYKILLFLMLPMAFPGMVLGIPQFLLIKNFGLLNTFAALILPGMASGYSIFLLKGFFDSLPKELFESAAIDGASEWTVFWHIAMGLSTPILSVIALGAFTGAYGNFMMAFLLCQNKSMWTMMVYLYQ